jgi:hypothetical protein
MYVEWEETHVFGTVELASYSYLQIYAWVLRITSALLVVEILFCDSPNHQIKVLA